MLHTRDLAGWVTFDVTAAVAAVAAGGPDFGWLLKKADETQSGRVDYDSREGTPGEAPRLVLVFTTSSGAADATPPVVAITSPGDGMLVSSPTVTVTGTAGDNVGLALLTVNGQPVTVTNGAFQTTVGLTEGNNTIFAIATDTSGLQSTATVAVTLDSTPPMLNVDSPTSGQPTNQVTIAVTGSASDPNGIASVTVNGAPVPLDGGRFNAPLALTEGANTLTVAATDTAGNQSQAAIAVTRFSLPAVTITSPADLSYLAATTVDVAGTVSDPVTSVVVNGVSAQVSGTSFTTQDVPLVEGGNTITAAATDTNGHTGTASINVVRDLTPPRVTIDDPADGSGVLTPTVTVSGLVNDIVDGTVNASEATVTLNGRPATVANRSYTVDVPLTPGDNVLTALAVDRSGNTGQASVTVHLDPASDPRLAVVSGDHQQAVIGTPVANPLVAVLLDAAGQPVPGKPVLFKVRGNDGSLDGGKREIAVLTGSDGRASAHFTLAGLDLKGKIAVFLAGSPGEVAGPLASHYQTPAERSKALRAAGVVGVITIPNPAAMDVPWSRMSLNRAHASMDLADPEFNDSAGIKTFMVFNPAQAEKLFAGSGHTFAEIAALGKDRKTLPRFPLAVSLQARATVKRTEIESSNVVARLPGSDPALRNEAVVLSAHIDHIGIGAPVDGDRIYNGAMDDGSGSALLLDMAANLAASAKGHGSEKSPEKPRRSILFVFVTAEEKGLLGSKYFAAHPTVDPKSIIADINVDMFLPIVPLKVLEIEGIAESDLGDRVSAIARSLGVKPVPDPEPLRNLFVRSDQYNFIRHGVPSLIMSVSADPGTPEQAIFKEWLAKRYHAPSDDLNQPVDLNAAALYEEITRRLLLEVANDPTRPAWKPDSFFRRFAVGGEAAAR